MHRLMAALFLTIAALFLAITARAEVLCALSPDAASYKASGDERPSGDVMQLARRVNTALQPACTPRCPEIGIFRNATAPNIALIVAEDQAKIVYAPQFFSTIYDKYGDGAIIAVIAHEYGHALAETTPAAWMKSSWKIELRADAWAGCALAKNNLAAKALKEAVDALAEHPPSSRAEPHPDWNQRWAALKTGYTHCGGNQPPLADAAPAPPARK